MRVGSLAGEVISGTSSLRELFPELSRRALWRNSSLGPSLPRTSSFRSERSQGRTPSAEQFSGASPTGTTYLRTALPPDGLLPTAPTPDGLLPSRPCLRRGPQPFSTSLPHRQPLQPSIMEAAGSTSQPRGPDGPARPTTPEVIVSTGLKTRSRSRTAWPGPTGSFSPAPMPQTEAIVERSSRTTCGSSADLGVSAKSTARCSSPIASQIR